MILPNLWSRTSSTSKKWYYRIYDPEFIVVSAGGACHSRIFSNVNPTCWREFFRMSIQLFVGHIFFECWSNFLLARVFSNVDPTFCWRDFLLWPWSRDVHRIGVSLTTSWGLNVNERAGSLNVLYVFVWKMSICMIFYDISGLYGGSAILQTTPPIREMRDGRARARCDGMRPSNTTMWDKNTTKWDKNTTEWDKNTTE